MPSSTSLSRSARNVADRLPASLARTQPAMAASQAAMRISRAARADDDPVGGGGGAGIPGQLAGHAIAQAREHRGPLLALERFGLALDGAAPPVQHRLAGTGTLRNGAVDPAFEQGRRGAKFVFEEQRLAERHQEIDVVAGIEVGDAHGAEGHARGGEVLGVGVLAVAFEMRARQHDGGGIGRGGKLLRRLGRHNGLVELPLVVGRPSLGQFRPLRRR